MSGSHGFDVVSQSSRDRVANCIARRAKDGRPLTLAMTAYALDLGLDVESIQSNPDKHIIEDELVNFARLSDV